jgi:hypothetical protein
MNLHGFFVKHPVAGSPTSWAIEVCETPADASLGDMHDSVEKQRSGDQDDESAVEKLVVPISGIHVYTTEHQGQAEGEDTPGHPMPEIDHIDPFRTLRHDSTPLKRDSQSWWCCKGEF